MARSGKKALKVVGIVAGVFVVVIGVAAAVYCDNNLNGEKRLIERAIDAGFVEKRATVNGATINYGEGPDNGPALLLVHGLPWPQQDV